MAVESKCIIVGAGEFFEHRIAPNSKDFVIAADGGYLYLHEQNIRVDMIIGDMDSLSIKPSHPNLVVLPKEKDDTDMLAAITYGLEMGYRVFHLYGGTGGRLDHTLANIQCLAYLSSIGARGYLHGSNYAVTAITNDHIEFDKNASGVISIFSHSDKAVGVEITGMKYSVKEHTLTNTYPLGVSNEFIGNDSKISVRQGTLIILFKQVQEVFR